MSDLTWERRLVEWADSVQGRPFVWGETDCASLVVQALSLLGHPAAVPGYHTVSAARRVLAGLDPATVLRDLGAVEVGIAFAQSGDVHLGEDPETEGLPAVAVHVAGVWVTSSQGRGVHLAHELSPGVTYRLPRPGRDRG